MPGDWGAFGAYLIGGISLAVLAVGSTAPGLLRVATDRLARVNPEYRRRIARHEAGHFLVGYALGVPVGSYDLGIDQSHVNFMESKLERKIFQGAKLSESEMLPLAVVSMSGVAAEAMEFDEVMGQSADLYDLQRILNRVDPKLSDASQQELTRWAVFQAASILKTNQERVGRVDGKDARWRERRGVLEDDRKRRAVNLSLILFNPTRTLHSFRCLQHPIYLAIVLIVPFRVRYAPSGPCSEARPRSRCH